MRLGMTMMLIVRVGVGVGSEEGRKVLSSSKHVVARSRIVLRTAHVGAMGTRRTEVDILVKITWTATRTFTLWSKVMNA